MTLRLNRGVLVGLRRGYSKLAQERRSCWGPAYQPLPTAAALWVEGCAGGARRFAGREGPGVRVETKVEEAETRTQEGTPPGEGKVVPSGEKDGIIDIKESEFHPTVEQLDISSGAREPYQTFKAPGKGNYTDNIRENIYWAEQGIGAMSLEMVMKSLTDELIRERRNWPRERQEAYKPLREAWHELSADVRDDLVRITALFIQEQTPKLERMGRPVFDLLLEDPRVIKALEGLEERDRELGEKVIMMASEQQLATMGEIELESMRVPEHREIVLQSHEKVKEALERMETFRRDYDDLIYMDITDISREEIQTRVADKILQYHDIAEFVESEVTGRLLQATELVGLEGHVHTREAKGLMDNVKEMEPLITEMDRMFKNLTMVPLDDTMGDKIRFWFFSMGRYRRSLEPKPRTPISALRWIGFMVGCFLFGLFYL